MKLNIKHIVCGRCKALVKAELEKIGVHSFTVELGEVETKRNLTVLQRTRLECALRQLGFELIDSSKNTLIEKLRKAIVDREHHADEDLKTRFKDYISQSVKLDYNFLNTLFSELEGITIEKYIIIHKIELIKELLVYNDFGLAEITHRLHYISAAQLSRQFKGITGLTPLHFRELRHTRNKISKIN
jgi:AraC-like DNA-binding protein